MVQGLRRVKNIYISQEELTENLENFNFGEMIKILGDLSGKVGNEIQ